MSLSQAHIILLLSIASAFFIESDGKDGKRALGNPRTRGWRRVGRGRGSVA